MSFIKKIIIKLCFPVFLAMILAGILSGCQPDKIKMQKKTKNREKNLTYEINLQSIEGQVDISTWNRDFIEINSNKIIYSGLKADLNSLNIEYGRDDKTFFIITKNPSRVEGKINLQLFIPHTIRTLVLNIGQGDIIINQYFGNLVITLEKGNLQTLFRGSILKINSLEARLALEIDTSSTADITIQNDAGPSDIKVKNISPISYFDFFSDQGSIDLSIQPEIDYELIAKYKNKNSEFNLNTDFQLLPNQEYDIISAVKGEKPHSFQVYLFNEKGMVNIETE